MHRRHEHRYPGAAVGQVEVSMPARGLHTEPTNLALDLDATKLPLETTAKSLSKVADGQPLNAPSSWRRT